MVAVRSLALFRRTELGVYDGNGVVSCLAAFGRQTQKAAVRVDLTEIESLGIPGGQIL